MIGDDLGLVVAVDNVVLAVFTDFENKRVTGRVADDVVAWRKGREVRNVFESFPCLFGARTSIENESWKVDLAQAKSVSTRSSFRHIVCKQCNRNAFGVDAIDSAADKIVRT